MPFPDRRRQPYTAASVCRPVNIKMLVEGDRTGDGIVLFDGIEIGHVVIVGRILSVAAVGDGSRKHASCTDLKIHDCSGLLSVRQYTQSSELAEDIRPGTFVRCGGHLRFTPDGSVMLMATACIPVFKASDIYMHALSVIEAYLRARRSLSAQQGNRLPQPQVVSVPQAQPKPTSMVGHYGANYGAAYTSQRPVGHPHQNPDTSAVNINISHPTHRHVQSAPAVTPGLPPHPGARKERELIIIAREFIETVKDGIDRTKLEHWLTAAGATSQQVLNVVDHLLDDGTLEMDAENALVLPLA